MEVSRSHLSEQTVPRPHLIRFVQIRFGGQTPRQYRQIDAVQGGKGAHFQQIGVQLTVGGYPVDGNRRGGAGRAAVRCGCRRGRRSRCGGREIDVGKVVQVGYDGNVIGVTAKRRGRCAGGSGSPAEAFSAE